MGIEMEWEPMMGGLEVGTELIAILIGIGLTLLLLYGIFTIVCYVLRALGLYTIAKQREIRNPWLAWLPCGDYWIVGSISDQYRYVVNGQIKRRRMILLALSAGAAAMGIATNSLSSEVVQTLLNQVLAGDTEEIPELIGMYVGGMLTTAGVLNFLGSCIGIALFVFYHLALYDFYCSCNPKYAVLFTVLGILFEVTVPFFVFFNRKKELGMPPRKDRIPEPKEPWEAAN